MRRGDTLIEVLVAFGVLSLAVVGAMAVMNQGSFLAQRSLETTLVRQEINSQAEAIRFLHDAYVATYEPGQTYNSSDPDSPTKEWLAMIDDITTYDATATKLSDIGDTCPTKPSESFVIDSRNARYVPSSSSKVTKASSFAQLTYTVSGSNATLNNAEGIWVEAVRSPDGPDQFQANLGYTDFYIYGCWPSIGQAKASTMGTVVRLYEPR